jgi:hypothetical protein
MLARKASEEEMPGATGRAHAFASLLEPPDAKFFQENADGHKKRKNGRPKKKRRELVELTPLIEIRTERGFPQRLEKASPKVRLFHSSTSQQQAIQL